MSGCEERRYLVVEGHSHERIVLSCRLAYHLILRVHHLGDDLPALRVRLRRVDEHRPEGLVCLSPERHLPQILHPAVLHRVDGILPELLQRRHVLHRERRRCGVAHLLPVSVPVGEAVV